MKLTPDQQEAMAEILASFRSPTEHRHLLTGNAGSGKTTLMRALCERLREKNPHIRVTVTAPTHKAVQVLREKVPDWVNCCTTHSLLSLELKAQRHKKVLKRAKAPRPIEADFIVVDEGSMVSAELMDWTDRVLSGIFTLFIADWAQLPPVNEEQSPCLDMVPASHLTTIVRQGEGNPILDAALSLRDQQVDAPVSFDWAKESNRGGQGLWRPERDKVDGWLYKAFLSDAFKADPDAFRCIAYTNKRVAALNAKIRGWIYGRKAWEQPFCEGERAINRAPVWKGEGNDRRLVIPTNAESTVLKIEPGKFVMTFPEIGEAAEWVAEIEAWDVVLKLDDGPAVPGCLPMNPEEVEAVQDRLRREAAFDPRRWGNFFEFQEALLNLQAIYAMTCHTSQGSTFGTVFVDFNDLAKRQRGNQLEMLKLFYVAVTRASQRVVLI